MSNIAGLSILTHYCNIDFIITGHFKQFLVNVCFQVADLSYSNTLSRLCKDIFRHTLIVQAVRHNLSCFLIAVRNNCSDLLSVICLSVIGLCTFFHAESCVDFCCRIIRRGCFVFAFKSNLHLRVHLISVFARVKHCHARHIGTIHSIFDNLAIGLSIADG